MCYDQSLIKAETVAYGMACSAHCRLLHDVENGFIQVRRF